MDFSLKQIMKVIIVLVCAVAVIGISIFLTNRNNENTTANQDALINTSPYKSVLSNGDFSNGINPWVPTIVGSYNGTWKILTEDDKSCIKIIAHKKKSDEGIYQKVKLKTGTKYTCTFFSKADDNSEINVALNGSYSNKATSIKLTTKWKKYTLNFINDGDNEALRFYDTNSKIPFYLADIQLKENI